jgi:hypothetical protein
MSCPLGVFVKALVVAVASYSAAQKNIFEEGQRRYR